MELRRTSSWNLSHLTVSWPGVMELFVECIIVVQPEPKFSTFTKDLHPDNFRNGLKEVRASVAVGLECQSRPQRTLRKHEGPPNGSRPLGIFCGWQGSLAALGTETKLLLLCVGVVGDGGGEEGIGEAGVVANLINVTLAGDFAIVQQGGIEGGLNALHQVIVAVKFLFQVALAALGIAHGE